MDSTLLTALVTGLSLAIPSIVATFVTNNAREALQAERMNNMSIKLDELAEEVKTLTAYDKRITLLEQQIKELIKFYERSKDHE